MPIWVDTYGSKLLLITDMVEVFNHEPFSSSDLIVKHLFKITVLIYEHFLFIIVVSQNIANVKHKPSRCEFFNVYLFCLSKYCKYETQTA